MILPVGTIILWDTGTYPEGWKLCDGANGTPDLRGFFVRGASDSGDLLSSGGVSTHKHAMPSTGTRSAHHHSVSGSTGPANYYTSTALGGSSYATLVDHTHTFSKNTGDAGSHGHSISDTGLSSNLPPHIKLYYIMKVE